jgi:DNA replication and repair protein RecF
LINYDLDGPPELFGVNLGISSAKENLELGIGLRKKPYGFEKRVSLNSLEKQKKNLKNLISIFWMVPHMSHLFQKGSEDRRNFLDLMISSTDNSHKKKLLEYKKYKNERIKILKSPEHRRDSDWLDVVENKMSQVGIILCDSRRVFLNSLNKSFKQIDRQVPILTMFLNGTLDKALERKPALFVEEFFRENLRNNRIRDSITGRTNLSANKTDLLVFDVKTNKEAKSFSTGEQKIIVISIIFSFLKFLEEVKSPNILFLLDDMFSYLDSRFINKIILKLNDLKFQTWITDVRVESISEITKFGSIIDKINIDDNRFKLINNRL